MTFSREEHAEMEGHAPFDLPDAIDLPSGRHLEGSKARVYFLLKRTALDGIRHRIGAEIGPPGWVPGYYLRRAWSGGNAGDRRVRDLRALGVGVEKREFESRTRGETRTFLYRWTGDPSEQVSNHPAPTRPLARGSFSSGLEREARTPERSGPSRASRGLRFWTSVGSPAEGSATRINPFAAHGHAVAVPRTLLSRRVAGLLDHDEALEEYRSALRAAWFAGSLREFVENGGEVVLWVAPEQAETINLLPELAAVLTRAGAAHQGELSRRVA